MNNTAVQASRGEAIYMEKVARTSLSSMVVPELNHLRFLCFPVVLARRVVLVPSYHEGAVPVASNKSGSRI